MTFKLISTLAALMFGFLFVALTVAPAAMLGPWGVEANPEATFMARRLAAAFLGFAVLTALSRDLAASPARRAIAFGLASALFMVAGFGLYEFFRGFASSGILAGIAVEIAFGISFLFIGRSAS